MKEKKYCVKCGKEIEKDINYCPYCGCMVNTINKENKEIEKEANFFGLMSAILFYGGGLVTSSFITFLPSNLRNTISTMSGLFPLAGIVIMIIGRIKYPDNKLLKIIMWCIIVTTIVSVLFFALFFMWCIVTCSHTDIRGCE